MWRCTTAPLPSAPQGPGWLAEVVYSESHDDDDGRTRNATSPKINMDKTLARTACVLYGKYRLGVGRIGTGYRYALGRISLVTLVVKCLLGSDFAFLVGKQVRWRASISAQIRCAAQSIDSIEFETCDRISDASNGPATV